MSTTIKAEIWRYGYDFIIEEIKEKEDVVKIPKCVIETIAETVGIDRDAIDMETKEGIIYAFEWFRDLLKVKKKDKTLLPPSKDFYDRHKEEATTLLKSQYTSSDLSKIALLVNPSPSKRWKIKPLLKAFRHLIDFETVFKTMVEKKNREKIVFTSCSVLLRQLPVFSKKNEDFPEAFDPIMVFCILVFLKRNMFLSFEMSFETIANILLFEISSFSSCERSIFKMNSLLVPSLNYPSKEFYNAFFDSSLTSSTSSKKFCRCCCQLSCEGSTGNNRITNNNNSNNDENSKKETKYDGFYQKPVKMMIENVIIPNAKAIRSLRGTECEHMFSPTNHVEAISLAAILYGIDLSLAECPSLELLKMQKDATDNVEYSPFFKFSSFSTWYSRSKKYFFDISRHFVPYFSSLYTPGQLDFFAHYEGFVAEKIRDVVVFTSDESLASGFSPPYLHPPSYPPAPNTSSNQITISVTPPSSPKSSSTSTTSSTALVVVATAQNSPLLQMTTTQNSAHRQHQHQHQQQQQQQQTKIAFFSSLEALTNKKLRSSSEIVYKGWHPKSKNTVSPISLEPLHDVLNEYGESGIVSFEIDEKKGGGGETVFVSYSLRDVCDLFINSRAYLICDEEGKVRYLTKRTVRKLKEMYDEGALGRPVVGSVGPSSSSSLSFTYDKDYESEKTNIDLLKAAVRIVDMRDVELSEHANEILKIGKSDEEARKQASNAFYKLLELGMFMRGWKVSSCSSSNASSPPPFPLSSAETIIEPERQPEVDLNVTTSLREYEEAIVLIKNTEMRRLVKSAPLLKVVYKSSPPHFASTVNMEQGFTVEDRVNIIREGTDGTIFSCMRMSSNFLVSSSYYYLSASLFKDPGFDISLLDEIF